MKLSTGYKKSIDNDSYVLLAGGGHKDINQIINDYGVMSITPSITFSNPISGDLLGNATTADRLKSTTQVGSATQPVYFNGGIPIVSTYSLNATINSGTTNRIAYYNSATSITGSSFASMDVNNRTVTIGNTSGALTLLNLTSQLSYGVSVIKFLNGSDEGYIASSWWSNDSYNTTSALQNETAHGMLFKLPRDGENFGYLFRNNSGLNLAFISSSNGNLYIRGLLYLGSTTQSAISIAAGIHVHDIRNVTVTPESFGDKTVNWYFANTGPSEFLDWMGVMHVKGWGGTDYYAWELAGSAGTSSKGLFFRDGVGSTWNDWKKIAYTDDLSFKVSRDNSTSNILPGKNKMSITEVLGSSVSDGSSLPTSSWYHVYTAEGSDTNYATQLALGMTINGVWYRKYLNKSWGSWIKVMTGYNIWVGLASSLPSSRSSSTIYFVYGT